LGFVHEIGIVGSHPGVSRHGGDGRPERPSPQHLICSRLLVASLPVGSAPTPSGGGNDEFFAARARSRRATLGNRTDSIVPPVGPSVCMARGCGTYACIHTTIGQRGRSVVCAPPLSIYSAWSTREAFPSCPSRPQPVVHWIHMTCVVAHSSLVAPSGYTHECNRRSKLVGQDSSIQITKKLAALSSIGARPRSTSLQKLLSRECQTAACLENEGACTHICLAGIPNRHTEVPSAPPRNGYLKSSLV
jgi:hypothetical protein